MAPDVARALARLAARGYRTGDDHLVFPGVIGSYLDASAREGRTLSDLILSELPR